MALMFDEIRYVPGGKYIVAPPVELRNSVIDCYQIIGGIISFRSIRPYINPWALGDDIICADGTAHIKIGRN